MIRTTLVSALYSKFGSCFGHFVRIQTIYTCNVFEYIYVHCQKM